VHLYKKSEKVDKLGDRWSFTSR